MFSRRQIFSFSLKKKTAFFSDCCSFSGLTAALPPPRPVIVLIFTHITFPRPMPFEIRFYLPNEGFNIPIRISRKVFGIWFSTFCRLNLTFILTTSGKSLFFSYLPPPYLPPPGFSGATLPRQLTIILQLPDDPRIVLNLILCLYLHNTEQFSAFRPPSEGVRKCHTVHVGRDCYNLLFFIFVLLKTLKIDGLLFQ